MGGWLVGLCGFGLGGLVVLRFVCDFSELLRFSFCERWGVVHRGCVCFFWWLGGGWVGVSFLKGRSYYWARWCVRPVYEILLMMRYVIFCDLHVIFYFWFIIHNFYFKVREPVGFSVHSAYVMQTHKHSLCMAQERANGRQEEKNRCTGVIETLNAPWIENSPWIHRCNIFWLDYSITRYVQVHMNI